MCYEHNDEILVFLRGNSFMTRRVLSVELYLNEHEYKRGPKGARNTLANVQLFILDERHLVDNSENR
jgi:hypothetical protein